MRSKRSTFVVTFSALAACTPTRPIPPAEPVPEPKPSETATEPEVDPVPEPDPSAEKPAVPADASATDGPVRLSSYPSVVNPRDQNGRVIHKAWNGSGCFVELPFPPLLPGQQRPPGTAPPTQTLPCPTALGDPAYDACKGGTVYTNIDRSGCVCFVMGNPPPVPKRMTCPKP